MKKIFGLFIYLFFLHGDVNSQITVEKNRVSPNFVGFKGILLIYEPEHNLIARALENRFGKYYNGEYKILDKQARKDSIYRDVQKFPFVVEIEHDHTTSSTSFFIVSMTDRVTGKQYETTSYPDNTIPPYSFINKYAKALEKIRTQ